MVFYKHEIKMNVKSLAIWSSIVGGMILVMVLLFPGMVDQMKEVTNAFSNMGIFSDAFGMDRINMGTAIGYYGVEAGAMLAIGGAMFAAIIGTGILSKEEGGHTTEFIYVTPNSRKYFLTQKLLASASVIVLFDVICFVLTVLGFFIIGERGDWDKIMLFHLAQVIMHLQIGAICFGISSFLRKTNIGLGIGIALLLYFLSMIANITKSVEWVRYITPYYYADAANLFDTMKIPLVHLAIGIAMATVAIVAAYVQYSKKDLNI